MRETCTYGLMRGNRTSLYGRFLNGHEVGNDRYSQAFDLTNVAPVLYSTYLPPCLIEKTGHS